MALQIRFLYAPAYNVGVSIERVADGLFYDLPTASFLATPTSRILVLSDKDPVTGAASGIYRGSIAFTPKAAWPDGYYIVSFFEVNSQTQPKQTRPVCMFDWFYMQDGDDGCNPPAPPPVTFTVGGLSLTATQQVQ